MSFINKIFGKAANASAAKVVSRVKAKEVQETARLLEKEGFKDVKIAQLDSDVVNLVGKKGNEVYTASMNFANRSQVDTWSTKSYVMDIFSSVVDTVKTAKGTMDGVIKSLKTVSKRTTSNGKLLKETTELQNCISGNHYKRVIDGNGNATYYKNVNGDFVELFPKK